jgi:DNA polymerase-3 subunit epsilon
VNPEAPIPASIETLTGIGTAAVEDAPPFRDIAAELRERLDGRVLVAHNARFDYGFLRNEFRRLSVPFASRLLCTVKLSRALFPGERRHNLDAVIARHGLSCARRHRALDDARVLWAFLTALRQTVPPTVIAAAVADQLKRPSLPPHLPAKTLDELPDAPGVYRFYGPEDRLLYVGKSVNLRSRVMAHFAADHRSSREMTLSQQVRRIEWSETAGELGALLAESREVKARLPLHNRKLRRRRDLWSIRFRPEAGPRAALEIVELRIRPGARLADLHGTFLSRRKARNWLERLAREQGLCWKRLGLEQGSGPCFAYQLQRCRGACVGDEPHARHDFRLITALAPLKMRDWPFRGRIGIREIGLFGDADIHVFDHWCYLGSARDEQALWPLLERDRMLEFDPDCYRILNSFLRRDNFRPKVLDLEGRDRPAPSQLDLV